MVDFKANELASLVNLGKLSFEDAQKKLGREFTPQEKAAFNFDADVPEDKAEFKGEPVNIELPNGMRFTLYTKSDVIIEGPITTDFDGTLAKLKEAGYTNPRIENGKFVVDSEGKSFEANIADSKSVKKANSERTVINNVANTVVEYASADVTSGQFVSATQSMRTKFEKMPEEKKEAIAQNVNKYMEAIQNGDKEQQEALKRTLLSDFGSPNGWLNPTDGQVIAAGVAVVAVTTAVLWATGGLSAIGEALSEAGSLAVATASTGAGKSVALSAAALALASCGDDPIVEVYKSQPGNMTQTNEQNTTVVVKDNSDLLRLLIEKVDKGNNLSKEQLDAINLFMQQNQGNYENILTYIKQQSNDNMERLNNLVNALIDAINNNGEKLNLNIDALKTLTGDIANRLYLALDDLKNSVKDNGKKIDKTNELLAEIRNILVNLPNNIKAKFQEDLTAIINGIASNGDKLDATNKMLKWINANIVRFKAQNGAQLAYLTNVVKCFAKDTSGKLCAIIDKLTKQNGKIDNLMELLCRLDENQENRNNKVINAINAVGDKVGDNDYSSIINAMCDGFNKLIGVNVEGFNKLIDSGNMTNELLANLNGKVSEIYDITCAIYKKPGEKIDIGPIVQELKNNGVTLEAIYSGMSVMNDNIVQMDANQKAMGKKIIELLEAINNNMPSGTDYTAILTKILNKIPDGLPSGGGSTEIDVTSINRRLDAILDAIKNHEVNVTVDVTGKCTCNCNCKPQPTPGPDPDPDPHCPTGDEVHEGVLTDLDYLLG